MKAVSQLDVLFAKPVAKVERIKTSYNLNKTLVEGFRTKCEEYALTQTEVMEAMLEEFMTRFVKPVPEKKKA